MFSLVALRGGEMSQLNPSLIPSPPSQLSSLAGIVIAFLVLQAMIAVVKDWEQVLYRHR